MKRSSVGALWTLGVAAAVLLAGAARAGAAETPKTEVRPVDGTPRILVNGADAIRTINQIYYFPTYSRPDGALVNDYRRGTWLRGVKGQIDRMAADGANTLILQLWWAELAEGRTVNFEPLDEAMRHAAQKGVLVILSPRVDMMPPLWWAKENGFPDPAFGLPCIPQEAGTDRSCIPREICAAGDPRCCTKPREELFCCALEFQSAPGSFAPPKVLLGQDGLPACRTVSNNERYKTCADCETDSYGWKYSSPAWGGPRFQQDYGEFLKALIARYRDAPALAGWLLALGPTGEDMYGPSYIVLRMVYGDLSGAAKSDQVMDYSDQAQGRFREWIRARYRSDAELQRAWGDGAVTLGAVRLPDPRKLFKDGKPAPFPDNFFLHFFVELDVLSPQGRDLYDFREAVRNESRAAFTRLFQDLDPQHVLIYGGTNNAGIFADPAIDALQGNNHVEHALNKLDESSLLAVLTALNARHGKASTYGIESTGNDSGVLRGAQGQDRSGQKSALKHAAETILCSGGYFGFASELEGPGGFFPTWSAEDRQILAEIASFKPTKDCVCGLVPSNRTVLFRNSVGDLVERLGLQAQYRCGRAPAAGAQGPSGQEQRVFPQQPGQGRPTAAPQGQEQRVFPSSSVGQQPSLQPGGGQARPYCGDGICDEFEKANPGMCNEDCR